LRNWADVVPACVQPGAVAVRSRVRAAFARSAENGKRCAGTEPGRRRNNVDDPDRYYGINENVTPLVAEPRRKPKWVRPGPRKQRREQSWVVNVLCGLLGGVVAGALCFGVGFLLLLLGVPNDGYIGVGFDSWNLPGTLLGVVAWIYTIRLTDRWRTRREAARLTK